MSIDSPDASPGGDNSSPPLQETAKQDLSNVADKAKHDLEGISQRAAEDVRELQHEASARVGEATEKAKSFAGDQKNLAAEQINGVAAAIGKVADELDTSEQQTVGRYARDLASGLSNLGKTIENRDVDDLMGMAQDFGRKQPMAFLGAAALAGFVASRFALASAHRRDSRASAAPSTGEASGAYQSATSSSFSSDPGAVNVREDNDVWSQ